jgi:predicted small integral membrane protein
MIVRSAKIFLAASVGLWMLLVAVNNLFDYRTNFDVVRHIMSMDTIPAGSPLAWRAMTSGGLHHLSYWLIIVAELASGAICLLGCRRLAQALRRDARGFNASKETAVLGLTLALGLYFTGFMIVGGEWFQMWRSDGWNMQEPAFRFIGGIGVVLIFLCQPDGDIHSGDA